VFVIVGLLLLDFVRLLLVISRGKLSELQTLSSSLYSRVIFLSTPAGCMARNKKAAALACC